MKDQRKLANRCLANEIPFFTLCGNDILALNVLKYYYKQAEVENCSKEFLDDLQLLITDFEGYSLEEPTKLKKPD